MLQKGQSFLSEEDQKRNNLLAEYRNLYEGDAHKVFDISGFFEDDDRRSEIFYININLPSMISDHFADMVAGGRILFDVKDETKQAAINDWAEKNKIKVKTYETAIAQSRDGYGALRLRQLNKEVVLDLIPNSNFYPVFDNTINNKLVEANIASFMDIYDHRDKKIKVVFIEHYEYAEDGTPLFEYQLWSTNESKKLMERLPLRLFDKTLPTEIQVLSDFDRIPIYIIDNLKSNSDKLGVSDYKKVLDLFDELNMRTTQISLQLWKHLNAKMGVPQGTLDENGEVKAMDFEMIEVPDGGKMPEYIVNDNPQIENGFKQIEFMIKMISAITKVPLETFGIDSRGGVEKVEAMRIRQYPIIRKVERKRMYFEDGFKKMIRDAMKAIGTELEEKEIRVVWEDVLPEDKFAETSTTEKELENRIISRLSAIKRDYGLDDKEAKEEIDRIDKESAQYGGVKKIVDKPQTVVQPEVDRVKTQNRDSQINQNLTKK